MLKLEIPADTCKGCPYLTTKVVDHNYYGEQSEMVMCSIFNKPIKDLKPCGNCLEKREENEEDIAAYADFLVNEINKMASETHNRTLDQVILKAVDAVRYTSNGIAVVPFSSLKSVIDSLREQ